MQMRCIYASYCFLINVIQLDKPSIFDRIIYSNNRGGEKHLISKIYLISQSYFMLLSNLEAI